MDVPWEAPRGKRRESIELKHIYFRAALGCDVFFLCGSEEILKEVKVEIERRG